VRTFAAGRGRLIASVLLAPTSTSRSLRPGPRGLADPADESTTVAASPDARYVRAALRRADLPVFTLLCLCGWLLSLAFLNRELDSDS